MIRTPLCNAETVAHYSQSRETRKFGTYLSSCATKTVITICLKHTLIAIKLAIYIIELAFFTVWRSCSTRREGTV
jgi:hypothetical protein